MHDFFGRCGLIGSLALLAGCGGGGGGGDPIAAFISPSATGTAALAAASLNSAERSTSLETGTLVRSDDEVSFGALSGTLNAASDTVNLTDGGEITLVFDGTDFAGRFIATPTGEDRTIGIVGVQTPADDLPSGSASYAGSAELTILDGSSVYALTGDAAITADFSSGGTVETSIANLAGTVQVGASAPTVVSDVATITFAESAIEDAAFTGGDVTITSTSLTTLSAAAESSLNGAFFGPDADEVGATFIVNDDAGGGITVFGTALAD